VQGLNSAVLVAAQNASVNVHAKKTSADSGAGYLSIPLREHGEPTYSYFVPGCNSVGRSFLSIIAIYSNTNVTLNQLSYNYTTDPIQQQQNLLEKRTMKVHSICMIVNTMSAIFSVVVTE